MRILPVFRSMNRRSSSINCRKKVSDRSVRPFEPGVLTLGAALKAYLEERPQNLDVGESI